MNPDVAAASDVPDIKIIIPGDDESHASPPNLMDEIRNSKERGGKLCILETIVFTWNMNHDT